MKQTRTMRRLFVMTLCLAVFALLSVGMTAHAAGSVYVAGVDVTQENHGLEGFVYTPASGESPAVLAVAEDLEMSGQYGEDGMIRFDLDALVIDFGTDSYGKLENTSGPVIVGTTSGAQLTLRATTGNREIVSRAASLTGDGYNAIEVGHLIVELGNGGNIVGGTATLSGATGGHAVLGDVTFRSGNYVYFYGGGAGVSGSTAASAVSGDVTVTGGDLSLMRGAVQSGGIEAPYALGGQLTMQGGEVQVSRGAPERPIVAVSDPYKSVIVSDYSTGPVSDLENTDYYSSGHFYIEVFDALTINDRVVTAQNANDILGDGRVSFDPNAPAGPTLSLNGATITNSASKPAIFSALPHLNVALSGENTVATTWNDAMTTDHRSFVFAFSGDGSLSVSGDDVGILASVQVRDASIEVSGNKGSAIRGELLTMHSGTLRAYGAATEDGYTNEGISAPVVMHGGTIYAYGGDGSGSYENTYFDEELSEDVTEFYPNDGGNGISGEITINGGAIYAFGGNSSAGEGGRGISGNIMLNGGTIEATGGEGKLGANGALRVRPQAPAVIGAALSVRAGNTAADAQTVTDLNSNYHTNPYIALSISPESTFLLRVKDTAVTTLNMDDILGDGKLSFAPGTEDTLPRLTMRDFGTQYSTARAIIESGYPNLEIELIGTSNFPNNYISNHIFKAASPVDGTPYMLTFVGDGTLNMYGGEQDGVCYSAISGNVTVKSGTITASGKSEFNQEYVTIAPAIDGNVSVLGGSLTVRDGNDSAKGGIAVSGDVYVSNGQLVLDGALGAVGASANVSVLSRVGFDLSFKAGTSEQSATDVLPENATTAARASKYLEISLVQQSSLVLRITAQNPEIAASIVLTKEGGMPISIAVPGVEEDGPTTQDVHIDIGVNGTYTLQVTKPGHTSVTINNLVFDGTPIDLAQHTNPQFAHITLHLGNIDTEAENGGTVGIDDLIALSNEQYYNKTVAQIEAIAVGRSGNYDLNNDGLVNFADLTIIRNSQNYGQSGTVAAYQ